MVRSFKVVEANLAEHSSAPRLRVEYWPIDRLKPYERNPRKNDKAVGRMRASIREYVFVIPVLARSTGEVIDGHLRLKGAIAENMLQVPVIPCDDWRPPVPASYIACLDDRTSAPAWQMRVARECLNVEPFVLPGGHCPNVSRLEALAKLLIEIAA